MSVARVGIVTGAARGIGRAIALRLARDGLDVVVNDLPAAAKELDTLVADIRAQKRRCLTIAGDVSREADLQNLVSTTVTELGGLDVMVANAGIGHSAPIISTSAAEWDLIQSVNTRSVFLSYKLAAIQMIKQGRGGRIIGACSTAAKQGMPELAAYCASKFAIKGLTQSAAAELVSHGITVNAYAPGVVQTSIWTELEESRLQRGLKGLPVNPDFPILAPDDVAGLVSYLIKPEAQFITGQSISINGGTYFD